MQTRSRTPVPEQFRSSNRSRGDTPLTPPASAVPTDQRPEPFTAPGYVTQAQWKFICDLLDKRDLFKSEGFFDKVNAMDHEEYAAYLEWLKERMKFTSRAKASEVITALKALPKKEQVAAKREEPQAPEVAPGLYALDHLVDELNPVRFYRVTHGKEESQWAGYVFVDRFASDDVFPVKGKERYRVLEEIAADPLAAAQRFGGEFQRCCVCSRGLTRKLSREMRIGPVCLRKHGAAWIPDVETYIEDARQRLIGRGEDPNASVKGGVKPLPRRGRW